MADEAEAQAAPLDHEMVADNALLGQTLQAREQGMGPAEVRVGGEHRRHPARLRGHADGPAEAVRSEVELVVAEGRSVVAHAGHELQLAPGLPGGGGELGSHAVVARVEDEDRSAAGESGLPFRDQGGEPGRTRPGRTGRPRGLPDVRSRYCLEPAVTASMTRSRLKLPGFWRGGNSLKLWSH